MNNPLALRWVAVLLMLATFLFMFQLNSGSKELRTGEAPQGGMSLQRTADAGEARCIVTSWQQRGLVDRARQHMRLDSRGFVPSYVLLLVFAAWRLRAQLQQPERRRLARLGGLVIIAMPIAGVLDLVENQGMQTMLDLAGGEIPTSLAMRVYLCSTIKIGLIIASLLIIAAMDVARVSGSSAAPRETPSPA